MKLVLKFIIALLAMITLSIGANAIDSPATINLAFSVILRAPLILSITSSLNFGNVTNDASYTMSPSGTLSLTTPGTGIIISNASASAGQVSLQGISNGQSITVAFTPPTEITNITATVTGATPTNPTVVSNSFNLTGGGGTILINVGARLNASGLPTSYTGGVITVSVTRNN
jgi:hypothetical protein